VLPYASRVVNFANCSCFSTPVNYTSNWLIGNCSLWLITAIVLVCSWLWTQTELVTQSEGPGIELCLTNGGNGLWSEQNLSRWIIIIIIIMRQYSAATQYPCSAFLFLFIFVSVFGWANPFARISTSLLYMWRGLPCV